MIVDNFDNRIRRFDMSWDGEDYYVCGQYNGVTGWKTFSVIGTNYIFPETNILQSFIISIVAVCTFSVSSHHCGHILHYDTAD